LQNQESCIVKALQTHLAEVEQGIKNMLNAIQNDIVLDSTKNGLRIWKRTKSFIHSNYAGMHKKAYFYERADSICDT
jgi:hypothetical protein